jgi:hypothetical protein
VAALAPHIPTRKGVFMKNVIVGDEVVITYSEALAISVEPAKKN